MKKQMICITGNIAVGKTEVARILAEKLGYELYKASTSFRELARKMNMSLVEFSYYADKNPHIDKQVELNTENVIKGKDKMVIDARLGFYVVPDSFKVYMTSVIDVAASRLYEAAKTRGKEEEYSSVAEAREAILLREQSERERYLEIYGVDIHDLSKYDYVVDTSDLTPEEVVNIIIEEYGKWEGK
jgi:cytidylate kinase